MVDLLNTYPYLWMLYAFAIISPVVAIAAYCFLPWKVGLRSHASVYEIAMGSLCSGTVKERLLVCDVMVTCMEPEY